MPAKATTDAPMASPTTAQKPARKVATRSAAANTNRPSSVSPRPLPLTRSQEEMPPPPPNRQASKSATPSHSRTNSASTNHNDDPSSDDGEGMESSAAASAVVEQPKGKGKGKKKATPVVNWHTEYSSRRGEDRSAQDALVDYLTEPGVWDRLRKTKLAPDMERICTHLSQLGYAERTTESVRQKLKKLNEHFKKTYNKHFLASGGSELQVNQTQKEMIDSENPYFFKLFEAFAETSTGMAPKFSWNSISGTVTGGSSNAINIDDQSDDEDPPSNGDARPRATPTKLSAAGKRTYDAVMAATGMDGEEYEEEEEGGEGSRGKRARRDLAEIEDDDGDQAPIDDYDDDALLASDSDHKPGRRQTPAQLRNPSSARSSRKAHSATDVMASAMSQIAETASTTQARHAKLMEKQDRRAEKESEREERKFQLSEKSAQEQTELARRQLDVNEATAKANQFATLTGAGMSIQMAMQTVYGVQGDWGVGGGGGLGGGLGGGGFRAPAPQEFQGPDGEGAYQGQGGY